MNSFIRFLAFIGIAWMLSTATSSMFGQQPNPLIHSGSIGETSVKPSNVSPLKGPFDYLPVEDWVGHKVVFLPSIIKEYGYIAFTRKPDISTEHPAIDSLAGKIGMIKELIYDQYRISRYVKIELEDHRIYYGNIINGTVDGIAFYDEIEAARSTYMNKTLWVQYDDLATYDVEKQEFGTVPLEKYEPVSIVDVVLGWYHDNPIRFICRARSGKVGFIDVTISHSNVANVLQKYDFAAKFLETDPRLIHKWPTAIWAAIEKSNILIGMSKEQVIMARREPDRINRSTSSHGIREQWVFEHGSGPDTYIYFINGKVSSIQD